MINEGFTLESAMRYFDENNNGFITRHEFNEAFKMMKITLNETLMKNCFVILDRNGDNHIDLIEFEEIFGKYFNTSGGPVKEAKADDLANDIIDVETAKDLAKQINNEIKKTQVYTDTKLEARSFEDLEKIENERIQ